MSLIKSDKGQSTVEYLLLLLVMFTLSMSVYRGLGLKDLLGDDSVVFRKLRNYITFTYRHGTADKEVESDYTTVHNTYFNGGNETHFFSHQEAYPSGP